MLDLEGISGFLGVIGPMLIAAFLVKMLMSGHAIASHQKRTRELHDEWWSKHNDYGDTAWLKSKVEQPTIEPEDDEPRIIRALGDFFGLRKTGE